PPAPPTPPAPVALARHGLAHPVALALLAVAATAAARAWDTGHAVTETHPATAREAPSRMSNHQAGRRGC
ncbi:hypothetical protein ACFV1Q_36510, partial [Streptomyces sp. NPDC059604]